MSPFFQIPLQVGILHCRSAQGFFYPTGIEEIAAVINTVVLPSGPFVQLVPLCTHIVGFLPLLLPFGCFVSSDGISHSFLKEILYMLPSCRVIPMQEPLPEEHRFSIRSLLHRNDIFNVICGKRTAILQNAGNPCAAVRTVNPCTLHESSVSCMDFPATNRTGALDISFFINDYSVLRQNIPTYVVNHSFR